MKLKLPTLPSVVEQDEMVRDIFKSARPFIEAHIKQRDAVNGTPTAYRAAMPLRVDLFFDAKGYIAGASFSQFFRDASDERQNTWCYHWTYDAPHCITIGHGKAYHDARGRMQTKHGRLIVSPLLFDTENARYIHPKATMIQTGRGTTLRFDD